MMWVTIPAPILGPKQTRTDACHVVIMQLQSGKSIFVVYGDRDDALAATRALRRSHVDSTMRTLVLGGNPINPRSGGQGGAALRGVIARRLGQVDDLMALDPLLVAQSASNRDVETIAAKRAEFGNWCREVDRARIAKSVPSDGTDHG